MFMINKQINKSCAKQWLWLAGLIPRCNHNRQHTWKLRALSKLRNQTPKQVKFRNVSKFRNFWNPQKTTEMLNTTITNTSQALFNACPYLIQLFTPISIKKQNPTFRRIPIKAWNVHSTNQCTTLNHKSGFLISY